MKFTLPNRLQASITPLKDPTMRKVRKPCKRLDIALHALSRKEFLVITIKLQEEIIRFVYARRDRFSRESVYNHTAALIKKALTDGQWSKLQDAWFVVYGGEVYWYGDRRTNILIYSVEHCLNPNVATLLAPAETADYCQPWRCPA